MKAIVNIAWLHPVHGDVVEGVCREHEKELLLALEVLGIKARGLPTSGFLECVRCNYYPCAPRNWIHELKGN